MFPMFVFYDFNFSFILFGMYRYGPFSLNTFILGTPHTHKTDTENDFIK